MIRKLREKPVEAEAVLWTGSNLTEMYLFLADRFRQEDWGSPEEGWTGAVFDIRHSVWLGVRTNEWVVKRANGQVYSCDDVVLRNDYELLED